MVLDSNFGWNNPCSRYLRNRGKGYSLQIKDVVMEPVNPMTPESKPQNTKTTSRNILLLFLSATGLGSIYLSSAVINTPRGNGGAGMAIICAGPGALLCSVLVLGVLLSRLLRNPSARKFSFTGGFIILYILLAVMAYMSPIWETINKVNKYGLYTGIADWRGRAYALDQIEKLEFSPNGCVDSKLILGEMASLNQADSDLWTESWQVNSCGEIHFYTIEFASDGVYSVIREGD